MFPLLLLVAPLITVICASNSTRIDSYKENTAMTRRLASRTGASSLHPPTSHNVSVGHTIIPNTSRGQPGTPNNHHQGPVSSNSLLKGTLNKNSLQRAPTGTNSLYRVPTSTHFDPFPAEVHYQRVPLARTQSSYHGELLPQPPSMSRSESSYSADRLPSGSLSRTQTSHHGDNVQPLPDSLIEHQPSQTSSRSSHTPSPIQKPNTEPLSNVSNDRHPRSNTMDSNHLRAGHLYKDGQPRTAANTRDSAGGIRGGQHPAGVRPVSEGLTAKQAANQAINDALRIVLEGFEIINPIHNPKREPSIYNLPNSEPLLYNLPKREPSSHNLPKREPSSHNLPKREPSSHNLPKREPSKIEPKKAPQQAKKAPQQAKEVPRQAKEAVRKPIDWASIEAVFGNQDAGLYFNRLIQQAEEAAKKAPQQAKEAVRKPTDWATIEAVFGNQDAGLYFSQLMR